MRALPCSTRPASRSMATTPDLGAPAREGPRTPADSPPRRSRLDGAGKSAAPAPDPIEQLKQLGELRQQGILTDEEFAAQKAKILG